MNMPQRSPLLARLASFRLQPPGQFVGKGIELALPLWCCETRLYGLKLGMGCAGVVRA